MMSLIATLTLATLPLETLSTSGASEPPLYQFPGIQSNAVGKKLQASMIWAGPDALGEGVALTFRKTFTLDKVPTHAALSIFADARYILWVNGKYVDRGPCRFQPNGPEYDVLEIAPHLKAGKNVLAVLVVGNLSGGKIMRHVPGLTALLDCDAQEVLQTDTSWRCTLKNPYQKVEAVWADLADRFVDARVFDGDWTAIGYDERDWQSAKSTDGSAWGPLTARRIPLLRETPVPTEASASLPATLSSGESLRFHTGRIVQAYPLISFTADAGTEMVIMPYNVTYIAKAGPQTYFPLDTKGTTEVEILVKKGKATITDMKLIERLYPFNRIGKFHSNDSFLNQLWEMCARSCEVLSEDSYVDCADRERVEWMDDTPPGFDITQTAMAGPAGPDGKTVFSDPRLLESLVRRTGLTLQPEGWVKAHTCSDRYDLHAKMEDRTCAWIEGLRLYYDATGDTRAIKEIWPSVVAQMDFFLQRRGDHGLISCRDWVVWSNPLSYATGETTTMNAFVQKALADSAILGAAIGEKADAARFAKEAEDLAKLINRILWDEKTGSYFSAVGTPEILPADQMFNKAITLTKQNDLYEPTLHANIFALDRGIVPPERRAQVLAAMLKLTPEKISGSLMVYYYVMKQMYAMDRPDLDARVLDMFRHGWKAMVASPWQCSWEDLEVIKGESKAHIYGMFPGYFLSAHVLGIRRDTPASNRQLVIEPHLGDLLEADGVVVTEFGPVPVSWKKTDGTLHFKVTIPANTEARLALPAKPSQEEITINGKPLRGIRQGTRIVLTLKAGTYEGSY